MSIVPASNVNLKVLNSLSLESASEYFFEVSNVQQIPEAFAFAKRYGLDVRVLGEGSNVILKPQLSGLLLRMVNKGVELLEQDDESVLVKVAAGENWHQWLVHAASQAWYGLENLALIPGSVGAAPVQNIGAYGIEVSSFIESVDVWDRLEQAFVKLTKQDCAFAYRDSVFRHNDRYLIVAVDFRLSKIFAPVLTYKPLAEFFAGSAVENLTPELLIEAVSSIRNSKLPDPKILPNAGSFFKNPIISQQQFKALQLKFPDIVSYPVGDQVKLAAGWLIEKAGLKGYRDGDLAMYDKQALVMVNYGQSDGLAVLRFAEKVSQVVFDLFSVHLEIEPVQL